MKQLAQQKRNNKGPECWVDVNEALWRLRIAPTPAELMGLADVINGQLVDLGSQRRSITTPPTLIASVLGPVTVAR